VHNNNNFFFSSNSLVVRSSIIIIDVDELSKVAVCCNPDKKKSVTAVYQALVNYPAKQLFLFFASLINCGYPKTQ
jgi:hypothetical protein